MIKKLIARAKELTGIYSLGFDPASFIGVALPLGFVVVVGGLLSFLLVFN